MAYAYINFKSKKALKEAVAAYNAAVIHGIVDGGHEDLAVRIFSPGPFGCKSNGQEFLEGPHYPAPHTWYAQVTVVDGIVTRVQ